MRAHEVSFLDLVQGEKQFQVPLYQRTYAWKIKQLEQLWRDLTDQAQALANPNGRSGHFLGSIVLAPSPGLSAGGVQRWLVVDGQQRLTTLMLALTAIKDHVRESEPAAADRIQRQYLVNEFRTGDEHLRLLPTQADREVFRSLVLGSGHDNGLTGGIAEAYQFFRAALVRADDPDDPEDINRIEQVIRSGLSIVEITADRDDNVFRIFESLNNTGLTLSQADLLRNYLFMRLPTRGEDVYRDLWMPLQNRLSSNELELLVWLDLVIRGNETVKQSDIYRAQQTRLENGGLHDEQVIVHFVADLGRRARHLERVLHPEKEPDNRVRVGLERLWEWGAQTSYPLVLHLLDLRERGITDAGEVAGALRYIESFLVRRMVCQVPSNNLNRVFNASPASVGEAADAAAAVQRYLSGRRRYWPNDIELRRSVRSRPFYWTGRWSQRFFVLRRLEESYRAAEPVDFAKAELTIEHVLPQTATDEWLSILEGEVTDEGGPQQLHDLLVHTLGNLTLTAENSRLSNDPFHRKQDILSASSLQMNREIADVSGWGKAQILHRADRLADRMIEVWPSPIDRGSESADEGRDWSLLRRACNVIPAGSWVTYGDMAELIGSHPVPVGVHLASHPITNAWRVLNVEGQVSSQFRWSEPDRIDDPVDLLTSEGLTFVGRRANPAQRLTARELADLLGMESSDPPLRAAANDPLESESGRRFLDQLGEAQPGAAGGVLDLLKKWQSAGGHLSFGRSDETSCWLAIAGSGWQDKETWPLAIYPRAGSVEIVFQHMRRRPVFDDADMRRELRDRLAVAGLVIPDAKLNLRPSFPISVVEDDPRRASITAALEWFARGYLAALSADVERMQAVRGG